MQKEFSSDLECLGIVWKEAVGKLMALCAFGFVDSLP